jgi:hypothetical protein
MIGFIAHYTLTQFGTTDNTELSLFYTLSVHRCTRTRILNLHNRILATGLSQSHCNFKSRVKFSCHFCSCQFSIAVLFSAVLRQLLRRSREYSRAVAYCRQPASTVTLGIQPRWDPWPYICSVSRLFFFFFFRCSSFDKREGLGFFIIGVPLLHLIPPEVTLK